MLKKMIHDPEYLVSIEFLSLIISIPLLTFFYKFVHLFFLSHSTHLPSPSTSRSNHQDLEFYEFMTSWWRGSPAAINFIKRPKHGSSFVFQSEIGHCFMKLLLSHTMSITSFPTFLVPSQHNLT